MTPVFCYFPHTFHKGGEIAIIARIVLPCQLPPVHGGGEQAGGRTGSGHVAYDIS